jgi:hypothetical protein
MVAPSVAEKRPPGHYPKVWPALRSLPPMLSARFLFGAVTGGAAGRALPFA